MESFFNRFNLGVKQSEGSLVAPSEEPNRLTVAIRIRPILKREEERANSEIIARTIDEHTIATMDLTEDFIGDILKKERIQREKRFLFDHAFDETASQTQVFENTGKSLIEFVLRGFNTALFAYGATGAGKTYTMLGTDTNPGVMALMLEELFKCLDSQENENYVVTMSYMEIYNENIKDLLSGKGEYLDLRDDGAKGMVVVGITAVKTTSPYEVMSNLRKGNRNRTQESTGANEFSSRSHAVLQISVAFKELNSKNQLVDKRVGKLSMVDLAGSERAAETQNRGIRMIEGASINRSLLALGNCINALVESGKKKKYVNYRDSKLTRLLKDSLGGNCKTVMIANISPVFAHYDETMNTLKYAYRARSIKNAIQQNQPSTLKLNSDTSSFQSSRVGLRKRHLSIKNTPAVRNNDENTHRDNDSVFTSLRREDNIRTERPSTNESKLSLNPTTGKQLGTFSKVRHVLDNLFSEEIAIKNQILDSEHAEILNSNKIVRLQLELKECEEKSLAALTKEQRANNETQILKIRRDMEQAALIQSDNSELIYDLQLRLGEVHEKVKETQPSFKDLDKRSNEMAHLMVQSHYMEINNLVLERNNSNTKTELSQKKNQVMSLDEQIRILNEIVRIQKRTLDDKKIESPKEISDLYQKIDEAKKKALVPLPVLPTGTKYERNTRHLATLTEDSMEGSPNNFFQTNFQKVKSLNGSSSSLLEKSKNNQPILHKNNSQLSDNKNNSTKKSGNENRTQLNSNFFTDFYESDRHSKPDSRNPSTKKTKTPENNNYQYKSSALNPAGRSSDKLNVKRR